MIPTPPNHCMGHLLLGATIPSWRPIRYEELANGRSGNVLLPLSFVLPEREQFIHRPDFCDNLEHSAFRCPIFYTLLYSWEMTEVVTNL
jgi:hypothetical protein